MRKKKGFTQSDLAKQLFVSDKTISSWEAGRTEPSLDFIVKLSELLECNVSYLIYGDANRSDVETEIKIRLTEKEFKMLQSFLKTNATFLKNSYQEDTYYQPTYRKFLNDGVVTEWLRIGKRGNQLIVNYKNWYDNKYCDEYEVEIDDAQNMDRIFKILGLEEIAIVKKTRDTYFYLNKYEIALDYVDGLGYFVEIEVKEYTTSALSEYDALIQLAKDLHLSLEHIDKRGYPYHLIFGDLSNLN